jgi:hypothetical protein
MHMTSLDFSGKLLLEYYIANMVFFTDMCTWQEAAYMALQWRAKTTVTAFYIGDGRLRHNTKYDFHLSYIYFKEFLYQLNLIYVYIYLYL